MQNIQLKPASSRDILLILEFIRELAVYEKLAHEVVATEEILHQNLFGEKAYAEVILAFVDETPVGFALFFHNFSTFLGKPGIYLEDLFVKPAYRNLGIGKKLLSHLARVAEERNCGRLEWWVLDWNEPAIKFYKKIGAEPMNDWTVFRVTGEALKTLGRQ